MQTTATYFLGGSSVELTDVNGDQVMTITTSMPFDAATLVMEFVSRDAQANSVDILQIDAGGDTLSKSPVGTLAPISVFAKDSLVAWDFKPLTAQQTVSITVRPTYPLGAGETIRVRGTLVGKTI